MLIINKNLNKYLEIEYKFQCWTVINEYTYNFLLYIVHFIYSLITQIIDIKSLHNN